MTEHYFLELLHCLFAGSEFQHNTLNNNNNNKSITGDIKLTFWDRVRKYVSISIEHDSEVTVNCRGTEKKEDEDHAVIE